jgi:hypothetical protein
MKIILTYPTQEIIIELLDNPVVKRWSEQLKIDAEWDSFSFRPSAIINNDKERDRYSKELITSIQKFNNRFNIEFPFVVSDTTFFSNNDLNTIHRYFTTASTFRSWTIGGPFLVDQKGFDFQDWNPFLFEINESVHRLQNYYYSIEKTLSAEVDMLTLRHKNYDRKSWFNHESEDWRHLDYSLECDVFMQYAICGKEFFQAYIDGDQCAHWDVTSQFCSYNNFFYIDVNGERNKVMNSDRFKIWLKGGAKLHTPWQYMPIGKVVSGNITPDNFKNLISIRTE